jgi:hypothetical protein
MCEHGPTYSCVVEQWMDRAPGFRKALKGLLVLEAGRTLLLPSITKEGEIAKHVEDMSTSV